VVESNVDAPKLEEMRLYVYGRPLHPELFGVFLQHKLDLGRYQADIWLLGLGHLVCFHTPEQTVTELVVQASELYSSAGLIEKLPLEKKSDFRHCLDDRVFYIVSTRAETMSQAVFEQVHREMLRFAETRGLFMPFDQWAEGKGLAPFSFIDYEHRTRELSVFAYHAFPSQNLILRTQSVFSLEAISSEPRATAEPEEPDA